MCDGIYILYISGSLIMDQALLLSVTINFPALSLLTVTSYSLSVLCAADDPNFQITTSSNPLQHRKMCVIVLLTCTET